MRVFVIVTVLSASIPGVALAQIDPAEAVPEAKPSGDAKAIFRDALEHFEHRRYREALRAFEHTYRIAPNADLWFNIARCHEELGEPELAAVHLRRYLRDQVDAPDREQVERRIAALVAEGRAREALGARDAMGSLRILTDHADARVSVDGRHVGSSPIDEPMPLPLGPHRIDVSLAGHVPFRAQVSIHARRLSRVHAELLPLTSYETVQSARPWTWAIASIAGASFAVGGGTAAASMSGGCAERSCGGAAEYALSLGVVAGVAALAAAFIESGQLTRGADSRHVQ